MKNQLQNLTGLSVLAAFGHPDDEGFGCGGTLAMLAAQGARINLVCATNGDVGEISDPSLATPENLAQVRQEEMRRAAAVTGITGLRFLDYRDSGMLGTEDNHHPNSLYQAEPDKVVAQLADIMRETRPDIVITHDPSGGYGHPDHTTLHRRVTQAFPLAADPSCSGKPLEGMKAWGPRLLYYVCFPRSSFRRMWQQMVDAGITPPFASLEVETIGTPDELVTTVVDVSAYVETKITSLNCHRTQMDPNGPFAQLPQDLVLEIMNTEYFSLASPQMTSKEGDLLAGLAQQFSV